MVRVGAYVGREPVTSAVVRVVAQKNLPPHHPPGYGG